MIGHPRPTAADLAAFVDRMQSRHLPVLERLDEAGVPGAHEAIERVAAHTTAPRSPTPSSRWMGSSTPRRPGRLALLALARGLEGEPRADALRDLG